MAENVCDILKEFFFGTSADVDDFRPALVANCVFNSFLSYITIISNIVTIHAIRKTILLPKPLRTLLLSLAASDVGVGLLVQPLYISTFETKTYRLHFQQGIVGHNYFLLYILALECCNHKCGQVLSCSSSSQISRTCDSQARHCCGDINMAVKRNYFFYCHLESTVHHLTSRRVCEHDCLPHSGGNCLLEDLYSLKATQNPDSRPSNPRSTTGSSK